MKARQLIVREIRQIEVEEFELGPVPADGILLANEYTAVSMGTEIYNWTRGSEPGRPASFPRPTGYCSVGRVLEIGAEVRGIDIGDRVAGQGNHASHGILRAVSSFVKVPEEVDLRAAAFMVMAAIALHGVRVARIELGESVVVYGLGLVGQLCAQLAGLAGAVPTIGVEIDAFRLDKAFGHGCDHGFNPGETEDLRRSIAEFCPEEGANVILECTGKPAVYPSAAALACMGGRVVAIGSPRGTVEMDFLADLHLREVSFLGAHQPKTPVVEHLYYRFTKERERALVMRLMAAGRLSLDHLITHKFEPECCQPAYSMMADDPKEMLGVLFRWS